MAAEGLQELHADNCPVADGAQLQRLRGLGTITLSGTQVGDSTVRELSSLPHLKRLALDGISLSDDAISSLAKLDGLQALDLSSVSSKGIAILATSLSQLEELRVAARNADDIAQLAKFTRLRELDLPIEADVRSWKALSGLSARIRLRSAQPPPANMPLPPNLISVALSGVANVEALAPLLQSKSLERLFLSAGGAALRDLPPSGLPGLREFFLEKEALDDEGLSRLARCPRLEALYISGNRITDGGLAAVRNAQFLHTVELRDTEIGDAACETLLTLPALHCLDLPGTHVTEHGAARLTKAPNLQSLALDGRQVTPLSMHALAQLPSLIELYLYGTEVNTASIELAAGLPRLIELNLTNVKLDAAAVAAIARMSALRVLRLSGFGPADFATALRAARPELVILGRLVPQQVGDGSHRPNPGRVQLRNT